MKQNHDLIKKYKKMNFYKKKNFERLKFHKDI